MSEAKMRNVGEIIEAKIRKVGEIIEFSQAMARLGFDVRMRENGDFVAVRRCKNKKEAVNNSKFATANLSATKGDKNV